MGTAGTTNKSQVYREIEQAFGQVPEWIKMLPDTGVQGFWAMFRDFYLAETKIPNKYKELIGLGVAAATRCRYCALFHTEAARLHGATDDEIAEASLMAGVSMMGSTFLNGQQTDYERFRNETLDIVKFVKRQQSSAAKPSQHAHT